MEYESKPIKCPWCRRKVATYDGRTTMDIRAACRYCRKLVVYHVGNGTTEIKELPERTESSGKRFW